MKSYVKYKPYPTIKLADRTWPDQEITQAPMWCSVDLRDGNQALEIPMGLEQKLAFFDFLVKMGFKEIEIGFPAASDTEYEFTRTLIEKNLIPDDVTIQVLTQSREHIIQKTFEALKGAKNAVVHLYNSTSTLQRDVVFQKSKEEILELAVYGAKMIVELAKNYPETNFVYEYSPESFTGTEMDYAAAVCNAVIDVWHPNTANKIIINLPATVEMATPNVYADQIEYMCRNLHCREDVLVSLHA
ncbi:MAG: 2-isopropylmalate synthase, partial [Eubacteriales bacterium]